MLSRVSLIKSKQPYNNKFSLTKNKQKMPRNVAFEGEFGKFFSKSTKDVTANAAASIYRAGIKFAVQSYDATKHAIQNFDAGRTITKTKELATDIKDSAPSKFKNFTEKVKELTREAVEDARKDKI